MKYFYVFQHNCATTQHHCQSLKKKKKDTHFYALRQPWYKCHLISRLILLEAPPLPAKTASTIGLTEDHNETCISYWNSGRERTVNMLVF